MDFNFFFKNKSKRSQFLILSASYLLLLLVFIYSLETDNFYISKSSENTLLDNILYETCYIGLNSNGSYIEDRYSNFSLDVTNYCNSLAYVCDLTIVNNTNLPSNQSLINYTFFNYSIVYNMLDLNYSKNFTC